MELIASENFVSSSVLECLGSVFTNKYGEGRPGQRYYGGVEVVDELERLAERRALHAFSLDPSAWRVNVQPYSGSPANLAVYMGLLQPSSPEPEKKTDGGLMGLHLLCGGHLTHGFFTDKRRVSASSHFFHSAPYYTDPSTGRIDYKGLARLARQHRPKLIIAGCSAYPREVDYAAFRAVCDEIGAWLMVDMSHTAGLIAAGCLKSPFPYADVVTTTTHKTLRGPRAALIFSRPALTARIHQAVFPGLQGGPHFNQIAAIATQMKAVATPEWKEYGSRVVQGAQQLAAALLEAGEPLITDGTDNHLILWDVSHRPRPHTSVSFATFMEWLLEAVHISVNRNSVRYSAEAAAVGVGAAPEGIRLGTAALATRGVHQAADWHRVARFLLQGCGLAEQLSTQLPSAVRECTRAAHRKSAALKWLETQHEVVQLREEVSQYAGQLPFPGGSVQP